MFEPNPQLIRKAKSIFSLRQSIYWVIGGSCSGKTTICRAIANQKNIQLIDMDERIFGSYGRLYTKERHPAMTTWFSAENPLAWVMSLSWAEFNALNRAANAEFLDLLADELVDNEANRPILIDGGITHPSILTQVMGSRNVLGLTISVTDSVHEWETGETRAAMKAMVQGLPDPEETWQKFLHFDKSISQTIEQECRENDIRTIHRDGNMTIDALAKKALAQFGFEVGENYN